MVPMMSARMEYWNARTELLTQVLSESGLDGWSACRVEE